MATKNESFFVINQEGVQRWDVTKRDLNAEQSLVEAFGSSLVRRNNSVVNIGGNYGHAGVALGNGFEVWSVHINKLSLNAPYTIADGIHTPVFNSPDLPVLPMVFTPQSGMNLVLGITIHRDGRYHYAGDHYLVAYDTSGRMWRLPVSNLYANCKLCHGQDVKKVNTAMEAVTLCCDLFTKSQWNADLYEGNKSGRTAAMFQFKPEGKGFTQLPFKLAAGKDWTTLCEKVADEKINQMMIPL